MPDCIVIGGGLAGMAAAAALGDAGFSVKVFESRGFLGGRAASYPYTGAQGEPETIDNCQHILLRCCVNLLDFYKRLGVSDRIRFHREFYFIEPGGHVSCMKASALPAPLHFSTSFPRLSFLSLRDKVSVARALWSVQMERRTRTDLDRISMLSWLLEKRQTKRAIERFWAPVLVSAVNETLDRMAASHGFQVFWLGFLARSNAYEMGIPAVSLSELYGSDAWQHLNGVEILPQHRVDSVVFDNGEVCGVLSSGVEHRADWFISAVPFERAAVLLPDLGLDFSQFGHSPITGIHLWFDRPVTDLPHGALLDRTIQWFFNKQDGRYLQLVVSASRSLTDMLRGEVIDLAVRELKEFLPAVAAAKIEKAHVVKEVRATFSAAPGLEAHRPGAATRVRNLFLAGDWTRSGWPATMEGAVRSGYIAAEAVTCAAGNPRKFLVPDIA
jgi:zeta-carotene desaturase